MMDSGKNTFSDHFDLKHLRLGNLTKEEVPWKSLTLGHPALLVCFRATMFVYVLACTISAHVQWPSIREWFFLTQWGELVFLTSCFLVFCFTVYAAVVPSKPKYLSAGSTRALYLLQNLSFNLEFFVSLFFWILVAPGKDTINFHNVNRHCVLFLLSFVNALLFCAPTVRLLHAVFTVLFIGCYSLFNFTLHLSGIESALYGSVSDWVAHPVRTPAIIFSAALVGPFFTNSLLLLLNRLRCCNSEPAAVTDSEGV